MNVTHVFQLILQHMILYNCDTPIYFSMLTPSEELCRSQRKYIIFHISQNWNRCRLISAWWRHQMETFSALLAIWVGNSPVTCEIPAQRPVTRSFDVFFDLRLNIRLSKQSWGWWFEMPSRPLWRHCNGLAMGHVYLKFTGCTIINTQNWQCKG